jgi:hypothetical protein
MTTLNARATCAHGKEPQLWQRSYGDGKHYWESEHGVIEVWSDLTDIEVLRVGLGDTAAFIEGFREGQREMNTKIHVRVSSLLEGSLLPERMTAYEHVLKAVEELAP